MAYGLLTKRLPWHNNHSQGERKFAAGESFTFPPNGAKIRFRSKNGSYYEYYEQLAGIKTK